MAVPTIASITPTVGPTMGRTMIDIDGTNFRLPPAIVPGPTNGEEQQTVQVLFGTEEALRVRVLSDDRVLALAPVQDAATVAITLRNLDDAGDPIVGEEVILASAFIYAMPRLTAEHPTELDRVVRMMKRELERQIISNVSTTVHTDFDEETGAALHTTKLSTLPGLVLGPPDLVRNFFYSENEEQDHDEGTPEGDFVTTEVPYTVDLQFELFGFSDRLGELLNLMHITTEFFRSNTFLRILKDGSVPALGWVEYEMEFQTDGDPKASRSVVNNSNLRQFAASFVIRGFDIDQLSSYDSGSIANAPKHEIVDRGRTHDDQDVELDPTVQIDVSSGTVEIVPGGPVVSSIKSGAGPGDC